MNLKHLLGRTGGLITAFALLASMMVVAGAAPDGSQTCSICGNRFAYRAYYYDGDMTYQQYYSVNDIDDLTNGGIVYFSRGSGGSLRAARYKGEYICQSCLEAKIADYKANHREGTSVDSTTGAASVPVTVAREAATFSVTVPTSIPLVVGADSKVTSPSDVKIINNSAGPVKVTAIAMNDGVWTMTDYNGGDRSKLAAEKVGSNKLGLSLTAGGNTVASSKNGSQTPAIDSTKWRITGKNTGNNDLPITVGAIASAVSTKIENAVTAANVVFTVAWDK